MDATQFNTIEDVFAAFGGPTAFARALGLKRPSTASEMKRRGSIPVDYWPLLVEISTNFGVSGLTYENLVRIHMVRQQASSSPEAAE